MVNTVRNNFFLLGLSLLFIPGISHAQEDLGYFYNDIVQKIIQHPYVLTYDKGSFDLPLERAIHLDATLVHQTGYSS
jgi:hypothetical protein